MASPYCKRLTHSNGSVDRMIAKATSMTRADFIHVPYPKIGRSTASASCEWVATEKIHGANVVIATDASRVRFGKRKSWLADDEPFFGWQILRLAFRNAALAIHAEWGGVGLIRIYGELFGGHYPHKDVRPVAGLSAVQTGIWYAPDLRFAVYDVTVEPENGGAAHFVGYDEMVRLVSSAEMATVPFLARGSQAEVEQLPVEFPTRIPALLGLPPIGANIAEGFVVKPVVTMPVDTRPAIKRKIQAFDEARFDESTAFDPDAYVDIEALIGLAEQLFNPARISSARSKVGRNDAAIRAEVVSDILVDLKDMFPRRMQTLQDTEKAELCAALTRRCLAALETGA